MKKALVLSAIAAVVAAPAFAQSSVSIYGRLNVSIEQQNLGGTKDAKLVDNSSRIGFKGTEDLGGGLKANFLIEHGFNAATGAAAGTFWGREAWVGLSGNFGSVRLGKAAATEAYFATADYVSLHNHDTGTSSDAFYAGPALIVGLANSITYTTPTISGFNASIQYGDSTAATGGENPLVLAANYDAGPLHVGFGYEKLGDAKTTAISALYQMGAYTFGGYVAKDSGLIDRTFYRLSGMYTLGNSEFHANFGQSGKIDGIAKSDATQWTLGYNYNLSKRTKVYGSYTRVDNGQGADYGFDPLGRDFSSWALGVRHNF